MPLEVSWQLLILIRFATTFSGKFHAGGMRTYFLNWEPFKKVRNIISQKTESRKGLKVKVKSLSRVRLFATPWTVAHQAPLSMGFSRQEYWSGLPFPSPGDLSNPGIEPRSPALQAGPLTSEPPGKPRKGLISFKYIVVSLPKCAICFLPPILDSFIFYMD